MATDQDIEDQLDDEMEDFEEEDFQEEEEEPEGVEVRAKRMGWLPEEEYKEKYDKDDWVDADEFMNRAENDPNTAKRLLRNMERRFEKMEKGVDALMEHQEREIEKVRRQAYEEAEAALEAKYKKAIEEGDEDLAAEAWEERKKLDGKPKQSGIDPRISSWIENNQWYTEDPIMADYANKYQALRESRGDSIEESLKKTTEYIQRKFPEEFPEMKKRKPGAMVNGDGRNNVAGGKKAKPGTYEALNRESRSRCDAFCRTMKQQKGWDEAKSRENFMMYAQPEMFE